MVDEKQSQAHPAPGSAADEKSAKGDIQERMDEVQEKGYLGDKVDPTPNENYSLETDEFRTPETDPELAKDAFLQARFPDSLQADLGPGAKADK